MDCAERKKSESKQNWPAHRVILGGRDQVNEMEMEKSSKVHRPDGSCSLSLLVQEVRDLQLPIHVAW